MNKELILKYKAEFDHWLNGGKLLQKQINLVIPAEWEEFTDDWDWPIDELAVIINDEYVELRKALAEGKTLQLNDGDRFVKNWGDAYPNKTPLETYPVHCYRIKPKFKVGNWVKRIKTGHISQISRVGYECDDAINVDGKIDGFLEEQASMKFELWHPQPGEWCWFHNGTVESLYFYKFHSNIPEGYVANVPRDMEHVLTSQIFKYCEPFIGKLPTIIKD